MKTALISGTSIEHSEVFRDWEPRPVETPYGRVTFITDGQLLAMNRHGFGEGVPPHAINHRANVDALRCLGVESVVTVSSVGSVRPDLAAGSIVSCADYISFAPATFIDDRMSAFAPVVGNPLLDAIADAHTSPIVRDQVYLQTRGPRFETRAEVRAIRSLGADVVGMTFASEADLILERGLDLTAFCMVDNFAHGVREQELSLTSFRKLVADNQREIDGFLRTVVDCLRRLA